MSFTVDPQVGRCPLKGYEGDAGCEGEPGPPGMKG